MNVKFLIPLAWTLWAVSLAGLGLVMVRLATERTHSPEAGRGLGLALALALLALLLAVGAGVYWAGKRQSVAGLCVCCLVLAYPLVILIAGPVVKGIKEWRWAREAARTGDFPGAAEKPLADAIARSDAVRLKELLGSQRPPEGRDRAGLNLLEFAVVSMCNRDTKLDCVRVLLEAGATARDAKDEKGQPLILAVLLSHYRIPNFRDAIALLLQHGADANQRDAAIGRTTLLYAGAHPDVVRLLVQHGADVEALDEYGQSAVVRFTSERNWEAAQFLVERGVRLDVATTNGVSLDYYLKDWKDSVFGEHPEGWDRLRAAIAQRRVQTTPPSAPTSAKP